MPTYIYFCETCNEEFEEFHSITTKLNECPKCKKSGVQSGAPKRLIANCSFILQGGGWANEGYSSK